jgi:hypothetical protein
MEDNSVSAKDPADIMGQMLTGFQVTQALHVAAKLGIVDHLADGPRSSHELANAVGAHEPSLRRVLGFLVTTGVLMFDKHGLFTATELGQLLRADHPQSERPWALLLGSPFIWRPWGELHGAVMSGRPAFEMVFGEPFFNYLGRSQQDNELFNAAMTSDSSTIPEILEVYDFSHLDRIVDVGGGQGSLLVGLLAQYPQATGVVYDLPSVIADAPKIEDPDVARRCEFVGGDMFASVPTGGDAYILKRIVHDWSDEEAITILRNCRQAMSDNGRVLLIETIRQPSSQHDPATAVDLMMLVLVTGRERTEEEFRTIYKQAGFRLSKVQRAGRRSIIEGVPS